MQQFISLTIVFVLALISPGPDFFITVRQSLCVNSKAGIMTALGIGCGLLIHVAYCILGLSIVIANSILLFNIIKFLGAGYLIWLGVRTIMARKNDIATLAAEDENRPHRTQTLSESFRIGIFTNLLNLKATMFMISLFAFVIHAATPCHIKVFYAFWMSGIAVLWFSFIAACFANKYVKNIYRRINRAVNIFFGTVLIAFGIKLALIER